MKKLRAEMTKTQIERNRILQKQKEEYESTIHSIVSKSNSHESENSRLKVEIANNLATTAE